MVILPHIKDYVRLCDQYQIVPVYKEIMVDLDTPISIYQKVTQGSTVGYLLESVEGGKHLARYSFIGFDSFLNFNYKNGQAIVTEDGIDRVIQGLPMETLRKVLKQYQGPIIEGLPRFYGGAVGYFGYDIVKYYENIPINNPDELELPDSSFVFTKIVLIFDHVQHRLKIVVNTRVTEAKVEEYTKAVELIDEVIRKIQGQTYLVNTRQKVKANVKVKSNTSKDEFIKRVEKAKEYIKQGDIFQVVLSQRFETELASHPFEVYRNLRSINPSPYLYYLDFGETKIIGSSPEMLVRVEERVVNTCPIAGTRPRGKNQEQDLLLEQELIGDEKERAEHLMLVDLGRNDLGKVCDHGSIKLRDFMSVERFSHVMHLITNLEGKLKSEIDGLEALEAAFPAGTVSGAPKIRAMQIIEELEGTARSIYAGAIGYFSFSGNLDTCITIRTLVVRNNKVYIQAGAGIVADSDPQKEYEETINKAKALLQTLQLREAVS